MSCFRCKVCRVERVLTHDFGHSTPYLFYKFMIIKITKFSCHYSFIFNEIRMKMNLLWCLKTILDDSSPWKWSKHKISSKYQNAHPINAWNKVSIWISHQSSVMTKSDDATLIRRLLLEYLLNTFKSFLFSLHSPLSALINPPEKKSQLELFIHFRCSTKAICQQIRINNRFS